MPVLLPPLPLTDEPLLGWADRVCFAFHSATFVLGSTTVAGMPRDRREADASKTLRRPSARSCWPAEEVQDAFAPLVPPALLGLDPCLLVTLPSELEPFSSGAL